MEGGREEAEETGGESTMKEYVQWRIRAAQRGLLLRVRALRLLPFARIA